MKENGLKRFIEKFFGDDEQTVKRRANLILLCGLSGIAIIFFSQVVPKSEPKATPSSGYSSEVNHQTALLEQRVADIVGSISGVGKAKVMITLEAGTEYIYAKEEKHTTDRSQDINGEDNRSMQERDNIESKYILIEGESGRKQALVEKQLEPVVKGVVVLCEGADNPVIEQRVTEVVKTALGIPTTRICVIKISN